MEDSEKFVNEKDYRREQKWLFFTLPFVCGVLLLVYILVCTLARGNPAPDDRNIAFDIGSHHVAWYGIFVFFGFVCAIYLICMKLYKYKFSVEPFYYFCIIGIPITILGARMGSCIIGQTEWSGFFNDFGSGLAIEWGVTFTVILALIYFPLVLANQKYWVMTLDENNKTVYRRISTWAYLDACVPAILIGQILGRFGNYFNGEIVGAITTNQGMVNFLKIFFPWMQNTESGNGWRLPLFFFEQIGNIIGLFLIYFVFEKITNKKFRTAGNLAIFYFLWYGSVRLVMCYFRFNGSGSNGETANLVTTIVWVVLAVVFLLLNMFVFSKYLRNKRIIWISFCGIGYFFKMLFNKKNAINYKTEWISQKSGFIRKPNELLYYNNF